MSGAFYLRSALHEMHSFSLFNAKSLKFEKDVPDTLAYTKKWFGSGFSIPLWYKNINKCLQIERNLGKLKHAPCRICFADVGSIMQLQRVQLDYLQRLSIVISFKFDNKRRYSQSNLKITVSSGNYLIQNSLLRSW